jgi:hypothetical protein
VGERDPRLEGGKAPPHPLTSCESELQSLQVGEELLRKARAVSQGIVERVGKVIGSDKLVSADRVLLAETFKRLWKVLGADRPGPSV